MINKQNEKWNENIETCLDCGIKWKKINKPCPVCFSSKSHYATKEQNEFDEGIGGQHNFEN